MLEQWIAAVNQIPYGPQPFRVLRTEWEVALDGVIEFFGRQPHNENRRRLLVAAIEMRSAQEAEGRRRKRGN